MTIDYSLPFALLKGCGRQLADALSQRGVGLDEFMTAPADVVMRRLGVTRCDILRGTAREEALAHAEKERRFMDSHGVKFVAYGSKEYPAALAACPDAPMGLFVLGSPTIGNGEHLAVVGTRRATPLGTGFTRRVISDLAKLTPEVCIVSGLAYGIDAAAHQAAMDNNLPTIAVLAHGLDTIYPSPHRNLAREILRKGGWLISEYPSGVKPYRPNFLARNRIVAGLSGGTLVVESEVKGGAMSTANYAFGYNREVMAMPGRVNDEMSSGCNHLIRKHKGALVTCAADIVEALGWKSCASHGNGATSGAGEPTLFSTLPEPQGAIYRRLSASGSNPVAFDDLCVALGIPAGELLGHLQEMEFDGVIDRLPGNRFCVAL